MDPTELREAAAATDLADLITERPRIALTGREYAAVAVVADRHLRSVPDEIRFLLRVKLVELGLLAEEDVSDLLPVKRNVA